MFLCVSTTHWIILYTGYSITLYQKYGRLFLRCSQSEMPRLILNSELGFSEFGSDSDVTRLQYWTSFYIAYTSVYRKCWKWYPSLWIGIMIKPTTEYEPLQGPSRSLVCLEESIIQHLILSFISDLMQCGHTDENLVDWELLMLVAC
jgi:hypothetical protein